MEFLLAGQRCQRSMQRPILRDIAQTRTDDEPPDAGAAPEERPSGEVPRASRCGLRAASRTAPDPPRPIARGVRGAPGAGGRVDATRPPVPFEVPDVPCADILDVLRIYKDPIRRFVVRAGLGSDADDVLQEVFVEVHLQLARGKKAPRGTRSLVFTVAWRKVIDCARAQHRERRRRDDEASAEDAPASRSSLDDNVDRARVARDALAELTPEEQVLVRSGVGDSDEHGAQAAAAEALGITKEALRSRVLRARRKFRDAVRRRMGKDAGDDE